MILTITICALTIICMVLSVLFCPYIKVKNVKLGLYWIICFCGAVLLLAFKALPLSSAIEGITANTSVNPLKILVLFISMTIISIYLGDAGFFDACAEYVFKKTGKGGIKLFLFLYITVAFLTVFTSNDIIVLTFTPPICIFCKKAKVSPIPYLFGEFVAANTWSMALIVGNPTNIYLATSYGISFFDYFLTMWFPTLVGGLVSLGVLLLLFRKSLLSSSDKIESEQSKVPVKKIQMTAALICLIICLITLAVSEFIGLEMWLICLVSCLALTLFNLVFGLIKEKNVKGILRVLSKAPYELIPFVLSMFIIVLSLDKCGITGKLSALLISGKQTDGLVFGVLSTLSANLLNNIPMSVLFEKIISGSSSLAVFGAIIGSNIGAFLTPVGALAGIMWNKILTSYDVKFSFAKFCLYGSIIAIPTIILSCLALMLIL